MEWKKSFSCKTQRVPDGTESIVDEMINILEVADICTDSLGVPTDKFVVFELHPTDLTPYPNKVDNFNYKHLKDFLNKHSGYYQYEIRYDSSRYYSVFYPEQVTGNTITDLRDGLLLARENMHIYYFE